MALLGKAFQENKDKFVQVCVTAQHREMVDPVLSLVEITPEYDSGQAKQHTLL